MKFISPFSRFIVKEESMVPVYKPGDHVLTFNWGWIKKGDVVVFRENQMSYIKRIDGIDGDFIYLSSDNKKNAAKIWKVARQQIIGRIILKY